MKNKIQILLDGQPVKEIRKLRKQKQLQYGLPSLIQQIDSLQTTSYLDIDPYQAILPLNEQGNELTPVKFKKRHPSLNIRAPKTKTRAIEDRTDPQNLLRQAIGRKNADDNISYRGYGWSGISTDRKHRHIPLIEIIRGVIYLANFPIELLDYKTSTTATMPSISKGTTTVRIDSLPIEDHAQWINLAPYSTSTRKIYDSLHQGYASSEYSFTFYDIATFLKRANNTNLEELISNPILLPNKSLINFARKLNNNVIKRYEAKDKKIKPRKLNLAEKENLLWYKVHKDFFYQNNFVEDSTFSYIPALTELVKQKP